MQSYSTIYKIHHSSLNQLRITYTRKPRQDAAAPITTIMRTEREEINALCTNESHDQNQKMEKMDPTAAPAATWLIV